MLDLRFRQIHLDFHTGPDIPDVGSSFDPEAFADTLAAAHVDSVTLFAKCHHGHLYYETDHEAKHPHLAKDLLTPQIEALRKRDIRCPIYISVQCDEYAANQHQDWLAILPDRRQVGPPPFEPGWQILDMASPYLDYLCEQVEEVMQKYAPVDGLFFDMCWDQPSVSKWAKAKMLEWGFDPECEKERARYSRKLVMTYMQRIQDVAERYQKGVPLWFNSRPLANLVEEKRFLQHVEIEALPTGGWGYLYFPLNVRLVRPFGMPMLGMTARFHKGWADFGGLRKPAALMYDCVHALAHGAGCSVGDQLHPVGELDAGAYQMIGEVYSYVEKCEPWCRDVQAPREIAVLVDVEQASSAPYQGIYRTLVREGYQYLSLTLEARWEDYPVVIVPECVEIGDSLRERLDAYEAAGGKIIEECPSELEESPYTVTYCRFPEAHRGSLPVGDHVFYEKGKRLLPEAGDEVLAQIVEPYFERSWKHFSSHFQTPARAEVSPYAAAVVRGNRAILALPVFRSAALHANPSSHALLSAVLKQLLPQPILRVKGPSYLEAVVNLSQEGAVIHLLSFAPRKVTPEMEVVEESIPACDFSLSYRVDRQVREVTLQPEGRPLAFSCTDGRIVVDIDRVDGHAMVVIDWSA